MIEKKKQSQVQEQRLIFVSAPAGPKSAFVLEAINAAAAQASPLLGAGLTVFRSDSQQSRVEGLDIFEKISQADLVIADISDNSPNVLFELGFAQASGKPIILLAEDTVSVPFDLAAFRVLLYQSNVPISNLVLRLRDVLLISLKGFSSEWDTRATRDRTIEGKAFISYSHADQEFLLRILVHLRPLERTGILDLWSDTKLKAGDRWRDEIRNALSKARIAIMLISADFLASDFIMSNELPPLLVAAEERGTRIIPIIVKPSRFLRDDRLARFHALNDPRSPVIRMSEADREELYAKLAETIELELGSFSNFQG